MSVTVDVVAVIEVLIIEGRTGWHQLLQPHLSDKHTARQVEMLQGRKSSTLRQSPETDTNADDTSSSDQRKKLLTAM